MKNEMGMYRTGEFASIANVTERTIRYYDKIGLLKPSFVMPNGYRQYTDKDLLKLQKILSLKQLGFSIEEIFPMVSNEVNLKDSLVLQLELLESRISHLEGIKETMESILKNVDSNTVDWNMIMSLVKISGNDASIIEHYKNSNNLRIRINLHDQYSINKQGWFPWLYSHIDFSKISRLLEIGCGNGKLWESKSVDLRHREIFLSDISKGMVDEVRQKLGKDFNCIVVDCQRIPFKNDYFDALVANHVLFYLNDIDKGLFEISRVLRPNGLFYCSTYGQDHMKEINEIVACFDPRVHLSQNQLYDRFGLENAQERLGQYFSKTEIIEYPDSLEINEAEPLIQYIMSCHGNQNELIGPRINEFRDYIKSILIKTGSIHITKQAGLFICTK